MSKALQAAAQTHHDSIERLQRQRCLGMVAKADEAAAPAAASKHSGPAGLANSKLPWLFEA
jgi:hypothetical protein